MHGCMPDGWTDGQAHLTLPRMSGWPHPLVPCFSCPIQTSAQAMEQWTKRRAARTRTWKAGWRGFVAHPPPPNDDKDKRRHGPESKGEGWMEGDHWLWNVQWAAVVVVAVHIPPHVCRFWVLLHFLYWLSVHGRLPMNGVNLGGQRLFG